MTKISTNWAITEPTRLKVALITPQWKQAMNVEYDALMMSKTWQLIPLSLKHNAVGNKWIFQLKRNVNGSM